jgi:hypothetical protein
MAINTKIRTRIEDCDEDENGELRIIPVGTVGKAVAWDGEYYDIEWENGAWTRWSPDEVLADADILEAL